MSKTKEWGLFAALKKGKFTALVTNATNPVMYVQNLMMNVGALIINALG